MFKQPDVDYINKKNFKINQYQARIYGQNVIHNRHGCIVTDSPLTIKNNINDNAKYHSISFGQDAIYKNCNLENESTLQ